MEICSDAARIAEEATGDGGVLVAIDSNMGAVVGAEEGAIEFDSSK